MSSPSPDVSSDIEWSVSSEGLSFAPHVGGIPQTYPEYIPIPDPGVSEPQSHHGYSVVSNSILQSPPMHSISSSKRHRAYYPTPVHEMAIHDPQVSRTNHVFEEYAKVCDERDIWKAKYEKLKKTYIKSLGVNAPTVSSGFQSFSTQMETSLTDQKPTFMVAAATPIALNTPSGTFDAFNSSGSSSSTIPFTRCLLSPLNKNDYKNVKFWFEDVYNALRKSGKKGDRPDPKEGKKSSILSCFMEDENGEPIPKATRDAAREAARRFFISLLQKKQAPLTWGKAPDDVADELLYTLESRYSWLRLCDNHWKAKKIITNSYSQWISRAQDEKGEVIDVDADDDDNTDKSSKRPRAKDDDTRRSKRPRVEGVQPTPRSRPAKITTERQRKDMFADTQITPAVAMIPLVRAGSESPRDGTPPPVAGPSSTSDPAPTSLDSADTPPVPGSLSRASARPLARPRASLAMIASASAPAPAPALALQDSQNVPATQNDTSSILAADRLSTEPPSCTAESPVIAATSGPSAGPPTSAPGHAANSDDQNDSQNVPSTSGAPKTTSTKKPVKKVKAKRVTHKSLGLEDWKKKNPNVDDKKFATYWRKLSPEGKKAFEKQAEELNSK